MAEKDQEEVLEFEKAKEMTVGQAARKQEDLEAGVSDSDGVLDRYIKTHREAIEAKKFDTNLHSPAVTEEPAEEVVQEEELAIHKVNKAADDISEVSKELEFEEEPAVQEEPNPVSISETIEEDWEENGEEVGMFNKKKVWIWAALVVLFIAALATAFVWMNGNEKSNNTASSSSSTTETSSSSDSAEAAIANFETLYKSFFTDATMTSLKNSEFGKLSELKAALDKIDSSSSAYADAKTKYDNLEKAIKAIQALNAQFDKDVIVDGEVDTSATVKAGQTLTATATGIDGVDATITSAVNFGRSQQSSGSATVAPVQDTNSAAVVETPATTTNVGSSAVIANNSNPLYGIAIPAGVSLQRDLSRVPYDWDKINNDPNNDAWNFNEGILEKVIATAQSRGYISGNQYILEKVNIINGNGYYNLYRPDGTYLFSINAKTGYFVGNGAGHADDLDY